MNQEMDEMKQELSGVKNKLGEIKHIFINLTHSGPMCEIDLDKNSIDQDWENSGANLSEENEDSEENLSRSSVSLKNIAALVEEVAATSMAPTMIKMVGTVQEAVSAKRVLKMHVESNLNY